MIKFTSHLQNGKKLIGIGLSRENCNRLLDGKPILFDGDQLEEFGLQFLIMGGETEETIHNSLKEFLKEKEN